MRFLADFRSRSRALLLASLAVATVAASCKDGPGEETTQDPPSPTDTTPSTWDPSGDAGECNVDALLEPYSYGAKVKTLLTGLPLDDAELKALEQDPSQLKSMIQGWLALPEADTTLTRFFMTAFQQTSGDRVSLFYLLGRNATAVGSFTNPQSPTADEMLNANFSESFARTVVELLNEGRPFTDVLTTDRFMMTTAQMAFLAFSDDEVVDDEQKRTPRTTAGDFDTIRLVRDQASAPPLAQAMDPTNANFGKFWHAGLAGLPAGCNVAATQTIDTTQNVDGQWRLANGVTPSFFVFSQLLLGRHQSVLRQGSTDCTTGASNKTPLIARDDYTDWRMVKIRQAADGETPTIFYEIPKLRTLDEMALHTPRLGFMTTPGFFSTWMNNEDNAARVTINQTLIVALGKSFEGVAVTDFSPPSIDAEHADPESECYGCHQTLDPMRDYFRASYTNFYGQQLDPERVDLQADFVFRGVEAQGNGIGDLANTLASHPDFPYAWAHKLCYYANSAPCVEGAELDRVVAAFRDSGFNFNTLVTELFASPLVSGSACVAGVDSGTTATIARRSTFCNQMSQRTGVEDICGIRTHFRDATTLQNKVRDAVASVPDDTFSRAVVEPVVIAETSMFSRANLEAACVQAATNGFT
ncbi:MAG: hypothetical protein HOV80_28850, partial [Polyangiaceae bacterium]|nr:hypothetical protein [Polyangiaceae bacterium]